MPRGSVSSLRLINVASIRRVIDDTSTQTVSGSHLTRCHTRAEVTFVACLLAKTTVPFFEPGGLRYSLLRTQSCQVESLLLVEDKEFALQSTVPYQSAAAELAHSSSSAKIIKLPFVGSEVAD